MNRLVLLCALLAVLYGGSQAIQFNAPLKVTGLMETVQMQPGNEGPFPCTESCWLYRKCIHSKTWSKVCRSPPQCHCHS
ncbi:hypothetical protein QR680_015847 [Steinernema hermaphroditum]|uniref:Uncharacterized protein n=1 Tax=Steinernema hermaphroditum TaxID=289476 RepID=A0AA39HBQ1_9BILA|nr:hypothetical protein QR680_015847 [Steinernema hermaphroditum]